MGLCVSPFTGPFEADVCIDLTAPATQNRLLLGFVEGLFRFALTVDTLGALKAW